MAAPTSTPSSLNGAAALLWQRQLQGTSAAPAVAAASTSYTNVTAQALLKQQEDQLRATRLLLQQRQLDELMASGSAAAVAGASPPASRSNSLLARGPVAGLLGLSSATTSQDALSALAAARRASVSSAVSEAAAKAAVEEEEDEEDDVSDEEYFKSFTTREGSDEEGASKEDTDDGKANESFPHKLYRMLYETEKKGQGSIASFLPSGRGFTIHRPKDFVNQIMPHYFTTRRIASFQRQLNLYGFRRISEGKEKGAYFHKDFMKGKRSRVQRIKRKSTASRPSVTSFAQRFATGPLQFPVVPTSALYAGAGLLSQNAAVAAAANNATKDFLLARFAGAQAAATIPPASASLLEMTRQGLLASAGTPQVGTNHQDILRNAAASLLFKTNNGNGGAF